MTIYGSEFDFAVPAGVEPQAFGDLFDDAIEGLGSAQGFYSIDAIQSDESITVLVGVEVPEGADADEYFASRIGSVLVPALESAGISSETFKQVVGTTASIFA